jgi:benzodiazapine receptor
VTETTPRERHDESLVADVSPLEDPVPNLPPRSPRSMIALGVALALPLAAGIIGARATRSSVRTWYPTLRKPSFNPPGWVFGPVWTALYLLMGVAMHLVWSASGRSAGRGRAVWLWVTQLGLNLLWSLIFFGRRSVAAAFVEILVLWVAIAATIREFAVRRPLAAALMLPYLGWTTFAAVLNGSLWRLNRER